MSSEHNCHITVKLCIIQLALTKDYEFYYDCFSSFPLTLALNKDASQGKSYVYLFMSESALIYEYLA